MWSISKYLSLNSTGLKWTKTLLEQPNQFTKGEIIYMLQMLHTLLHVCCAYNYSKWLNQLIKLCSWCETTHLNTSHS